MATTPLANDVEAGLATTAREKESLKNDHTPGHRPYLAPAEEMPPARHLLVTLVICLLVTFSLAAVIAPKSWSGEPGRDVDRTPVSVDVIVVATDESSFARLLHAVSPESLHALLHRYFPDTYRHGVYASDTEALEAVHRANAALATSLAKLAKRQNGGSNGTTATPPPPPPPPPPTTTTTPPPPPPPPTGTSDTSVPPPPPPPTDTATTPPPTSGTLPPTDTSSSETPVSSPSTSHSGRITTTTRAGTTPPPEPPTTSRPLKPVTSTYLSTMNGTPTTVITTTYVPAEQATTTRPSGSLQTDAAAAHRGDLLLKAAAGVLFGGVLLL